nr:hypothetical protein Iba_chr07fCG5000 [Ipomoea batatas]
MKNWIAFLYLRNNWHHWQPQQFEAPRFPMSRHTVIAKKTRYFEGENSARTAMTLLAKTLKEKNNPVVSENGHKNLLLKTSTNLHQKLVVRSYLMSRCGIRVPPNPIYHRHFSVTGSLRKRQRYYKKLPHRLLSYNVTSKTTVNYSIHLIIKVTYDFSKNDAQSFGGFEAWRVNPEAVLEEEVVPIHGKHLKPCTRNPIPITPSRPLATPPTSLAFTPSRCPGQFLEDAHSKHARGQMHVLYSEAKCHEAKGAWTLRKMHKDVISSLVPSSKAGSLTGSKLALIDWLDRMNRKG